MNDQIRDILKVALEDNLRLWDVIGQIYDLGAEATKRQTPKGLPGVTEQQVASAICRYEPLDQGSQLVSILTEWFNDPNRDAPVEPTIHPDLEWLATRPVTDFRLNCDRSKVLGFFRTNDSVGVRLKPVDGRVYASYDPPVFSLEAIHQARRHLARKEVNAIVRERAESLDLNNLPDYETWFEEHGSSVTLPEITEGRLTGPGTTVHELYTHFRARLLDELRQAGVIGEEQ